MNERELASEGGDIRAVYSIQNWIKAVDDFLTRKRNIFENFNPNDIIKVMTLSDGQLKILNIIAEKSGRRSDVDVLFLDTDITEASGLSAEEVNKYLNCCTSRHG